MKRKTAMWWVSAAVTALPMAYIVAPQVEGLAMILYLKSLGVTYTPFDQMTNPLLLSVLPENWDTGMFVLNSAVWSVMVGFGRQVLLALWPDPEARLVEPSKADESRQLLDQIGGNKWRS